MGRISKENYYLDIAETVLERATCLRRVYGAIIVKNDEIISTGYNQRREDGRTAWTWGSAHGRPAGAPGESGTSCAAAYTPRPTPLSPPAAGIWWAARCIWWAGTAGPGAAGRRHQLRHVPQAGDQRGISKVVIRKTETEFEVVDVQDWVQQEDDVPAL